MKSSTPVERQPDCSQILKKEAGPLPHFKSEARQFPRWKRLFDLVCVGASISIWSVVMLLVMAWIRMVSPGPVFYYQERVGYRGKRFTIYKFRSMKVDTATNMHELYIQQLVPADRPMTKLDAFGDPRLIPGGRVLRMLGLDELPQIFNVLRGEMSLVGPRPCTLHEFELYQGVQMERFNALPGLTGYWQVNGKNKTTFNKMVELDIFYVRNMSFWLDLLIVVKTLPSITFSIFDSWKKPVCRTT